MHVHNNKYEPRKCPRCGGSFTCTGDSNCWCMKEKMPDKLRDFLSMRYEECLCKSCVDELRETV